MDELSMGIIIEAGKEKKENWSGQLIQVGKNFPPSDTWNASRIIFNWRVGEIGW